MAIGIRSSSGLDLDFVHRNKYLVSDDFNLGRITFGCVSLIKWKRLIKRYLGDDFASMYMLLQDIEDIQFFVAREIWEKYYGFKWISEVSLSLWGMQILANLPLLQKFSHNDSIICLCFL